MKTPENEIEKAIRETLVIENPESIGIAVKKIIDSLSPLTTDTVSDEEIRDMFIEQNKCGWSKGTLSEFKKGEYVNQEINDEYLNFKAGFMMRSRLSLAGRSDQDVRALATIYYSGHGDPATVVTNETYWLIENENQEWYFPKFYWEDCGNGKIGRTKALWLKDANNALKFHTQKEAQEFADGFGRFEFEPVKVTEHISLSHPPKDKVEAVEFGVQVFRNVQMCAKVELQLKPKYESDVFTWHQIKEAIMNDKKDK